LALWGEEIEVRTHWNVLGRHEHEREARQFAKDGNTGEILVSPSGTAEDSLQL